MARNNPRVGRYARPVAVPFPSPRLRGEGIGKRKGTDGETRLCYMLGFAESCSTTPPSLPGLSASTTRW